MAGVLVRHEPLRNFVRAILTATGSGVDEAVVVADHLVDANLAGHDSHGVGLLPMYVRDRQAGYLHANRHAILVREDGVIGVFDGNLGYGHVGAREATAWGMERTKQSGAAIFSLRNAYHIARVGTYGGQACAAGLISIFFVNVVAGGLQKVAAFGGADARLHTNPICIGIPAGEGHPSFILDFATSQIAMGKVRIAYNEKRQMPPGSLLDSNGLPSTDPAVIFEEPFGAILPFGAHKGSGLAVMCELLGGVLSGGETNQSTAPRKGGLVNNMLGILIDPGRFTELPYFHREIEAVLNHVRASAPISPDRPVMTAGEPERAARAQRLSEGVPIDLASWTDILAAAKNVGVSHDARSAPTTPSSYP